MNTIQSEWEHFQKIVIPEDASQTQIIEMKKAFYAGAMSLMRMQHRLFDSGMNEDAVIAIIDGIESELIMFADMARHGKISKAA